MDNEELKQTPQNDPAAEEAAATASPDGKEEQKDTKKTKKEKKSELDELKEKLASLEKQIKEKDDSYLRMAAEYDNFRRRSREEREAAYDNAVADTVAELLPILDNLERATGFDDGEKVKEGLAMTLKTVSSALSNLHVEIFGAKGDTFDPKIHNAILHEEDEEKGEGEITEVFQKGYKKGSKVIRFAMVKTVN